MKKRLLALIACAFLLLSGCAAMLERGHETVTTHVDYAVTEDESVLRAESYQGLVNAMLYFVNGHRAEGTIRLYNYTGDVEADLANARNEVMYGDPLGAYSVRALSYDVTRILTYYEVDLRITYSRTAQEVNALREVLGLAGVRQELRQLATGQEGRAVFLASYFSGDKELVEELLELVSMEELGKRYPHQLSGGQKQRVAFARALAPNPQLLLLDEPFAAIDAKVRRELRTWLKDMIDRVKITSIFVTHDQEEAMEVAGTIILTNQGRIEQIGTPEEICKNPKTEFVADFIDVKLGTGHF